MILTRRVLLPASGVWIAYSTIDGVVDLGWHEDTWGSGGALSYLSRVDRPQLASFRGAVNALVTRVISTRLFT